MENILFAVSTSEELSLIIVAAPNKQRVREYINKNNHYHGDEYNVVPVSSGDRYYQEDPEIHFEVTGASKIETDHQYGEVSWKHFIDILHEQNRISFVFEEIFVDGILYYGLSIDLVEELEEQCGHSLNDFSEFCDAYGIDTNKITFEEVEMLLNNDLTLIELKEQQMKEGK